MALEQWKITFPNSFKCSSKEQNQGYLAYTSMGLVIQLSYTQFYIGLKIKKIRKQNSSFPPTIKFHGDKKCVKEIGQNGIEIRLPLLRFGTSGVLVAEFLPVSFVVFSVDTYPRHPVAILQSYLLRIGVWNESRKAKLAEKEMFGGPQTPILNS